ncbi:MAG: class I SAM-dependent RNA methyltransferase [Nitrospirota bacterium]
MILRASIPVYGGFTISRDDRIIFIRGAIPGELVEVSIDESKKDYSLASVRKVIEPSEFRIEPQCPVFGECGGCHLQFISYEKQVSMKEEILLDSLKRIGDIEIQLLPALTDMDWNYRHRAQFKVSKSAMGFYKEWTRDVVQFNECPLMVEEINEIFKKVKTLNLSAIKEVHITYGDIPIVLIKGSPFNEDIAERFAGIGFGGIAFEDGSYRGKGYVSLDLNGLRYTVSPWSFFQADWGLNTKVVEMILNELSPINDRRVLDLYAGAGNFSLHIARNAKEVIGIEENVYSIKDGERNIAINKISNYRFIRMTAERYRFQGNFDIVLLDPPRPGLTSEVVKKIIESSPQRIVYISCNPSTLARDLKRLKERYDIDSAMLIDFFPNTYHIEAVAFLHLR